MKKLTILFALFILGCNGPIHPPLYNVGDRISIKIDESHKKLGVITDVNWCGEYGYFEYTVFSNNKYIILKVDQIESLVDPMPQGGEWLKLKPN